MANENNTARQTQILLGLHENFGINTDRILFLNPRDPDEPWIPPTELESIARQVGGFQTINVTHDKFIPETMQVVYQTLVIDNSDRSFIRSGVAKVGEMPNGIEMDADILAAGRSLGAALTAAGFHPYKSGSVVPRDLMRQRAQKENLTDADKSMQFAGDEAALRLNDLRHIHKLANDKGLWVGNEQSRYRAELFDKFGVHTTAMMDKAHRAAVINWLTTYKEEPSYLSSVPVEYREDALMA